MKNKILYERSLRTCIIMLVVCIVFKLFGAEWFDLNTSIPILQKLDKIIINNCILSFLYSLIFLFINFYLITIIYTKNYKSKNIILYTFIVSFVCLIVKLIVYNFSVYSTFIVDYVFLKINCNINSDKREWKEFILDILLNLIYQIISMFIKEVGCNIGQYNLMTTFLLNLDYYVMSVITYLYLKEGDKNLCQLFHQYFSSLQRELLKKRSKNYSENKGDD